MMARKKGDCLVKYETKAITKGVCPFCGENRRGRVVKVVRIESVASENPEVTFSPEEERVVRLLFHHNVGKTLCGDCLT